MILINAKCQQNNDFETGEDFDIYIKTQSFVVNYRHKQEKFHTK